MPLTEGAPRLCWCILASTYDPVMSQVFFDELSLREPDYHLGAGAGTHARDDGSSNARLRAIS